MSAAARALRLASVAAALLTGAGFIPARAQTAVAFSPPDGPMLLTRTLRRSLADGKEVVSRRTYELHFVHEGGGFRVDGKLIESAVEAPPILHALAEIERARADPGLFPMRLGADGLIMPSTTEPASDARRQAAGQAARQIERSALPPAQKAAAIGVLGQLAAKGAQTPIPADLFRPVPGRRVESRDVAMSDGGHGIVTIEIEATPAPSGNLLASLDHTITTALGSDRRVVRERWTLLPEYTQGHGIILPRR